MNGEILKHIVEMEDKFQKLSEIEDLKVVDRGLLLDAILDVTAILKEQSKKGEVPTLLENNMIIVDRLYESLNDFKELYIHCTHPKK